MAGSEQRPTDDVEGHGRRLPPEDETTGDDRGGRVPDDTEGHGRYWQDSEAVDEDQVAEEDTEGHGWRL
jgi:hypothetical protein